jgi:hypothetical protein
MPTRLKLILLGMKSQKITVFKILFFIFMISIINFNLTEKHDEHIDYQIKLKQKILNLFYENNIFLADIDKLLEISIFKTSKNLEISFLKYFKKNEKVSFGCFFKDLKDIKNKVINKKWD